MKFLHHGMMFLLISMATSSYGQGKSIRPPQDSWSLGYSLIHENLPEGVTYKPVTILGNFPVWSRKRFTIYAESQLTKAFSPITVRTDFEFGVNMGLSFYLLYTDRFRINAALGSGPHFITIETGRQARGFIFSDNFELGAAYDVKSFDTSLLLKFRYRHISNAGLKEPNGGIDNFFVVAGLTSRL